MGDRSAARAAARATVFGEPGALPLLFTPVVDRLLQPTGEVPRVLVSGGRGTGKTTVLRQLAQRRAGNVLLLNLRRPADLRRLPGLAPLPDGHWLLVDNADADPDALVDRLGSWPALPGLVITESTAHLEAASEAWAWLREVASEQITLFPFPRGWEREVLDGCLNGYGLTAADRDVWRAALIDVTAGQPALLAHGLREVALWATDGAGVTAQGARDKLGDAMLEAMPWVHQALRDLEAVDPGGLAALRRLRDDRGWAPDPLTRLRLYRVGLASPAPDGARPRVPRLLWPLLDAVEPADDDAAPRERVVSLVSRAVDDGGVVIGRAGGRDVVEVSLVENQWRVWQELEAAGAPVPVETLAERLGVARGGANSVIQRMRSKLEKAGLGQAIGNVWGEGYELQREIPWQGGA